MEENSLYSLKENYGMFINGKECPSISGDTMDIINPATSEKVSTLAIGNISDVNKAVEAAQQAFPKWSKSSPAERRNILLKIASRVEENQERLAFLETLTNGKPIRESSMIDVPAVVEVFRYFASVINTHSDEVTFLNNDIMSISYREPLGVVGQIIPWNFPLTLAAWKLAPAIASGNCTVLKPSEITSATILELMALVADIIPPGVVNIVTGTGDSVGQAILEHPDIQKLAFTGSTRVGYKVAESAAKRLIPATLELGGKSANIIFEDANWDKALEGAIFGILFNQGECCVAGSRLLIQKSIYQKFLDQLKDKFENIKIGNPLNPETQIGSLVSETQLNRVMGYIKLAKEEGGTILTGGYRVTTEGLEKGFFVAPTIITDILNTKRACQEEIFGPVIIVTPFETEEEAIELANESEYGLAGAVWSQNINRAIRVSRAIQSGVLWINNYMDFQPQVAFGGYKKSGLGRENHKMLLDAYSRIKSIVINMNENPMGLY